MNKHKCCLSVLWRWVISYTLALCIMLSFMLSVSGYLLNQIEEQATQASLSAIKGFVRDMDAMFKNIETMMNNISLNQNITTLYSVIGPQRPYHQYVMYEAINDMRVYNVSNEYMNNASPLIYIKNRDGERYFLRPGARYELKLLHTISDFSQSEDFEQWISRFDKVYSAVSYQMIPSIDSSGNRYNSICLFKTLYVTSEKKVGATLFIDIDTNQLTEKMKNFAWLSGSMLTVLDNNSNSLLGVSGQIKANRMDNRAEA